MNRLTKGTRPVGRPKLRYTKDTCKCALNCDEALDRQKSKVENRAEERQPIRQTCDKVNDKRVNAYKKQSDKRRRNKNLLHIMCGYQCDKAVNKNDTREVI